MGLSFNVNFLFNFNWIIITFYEYTKEHFELGI